IKLRHMLEWSSLYRVTLLLSKINDDSDLDAEAAILYGKVCTNTRLACGRLCIQRAYIVLWMHAGSLESMREA
ncbi:transforming growth factor, beta receptor associated protein 1, partial [Desmophyllum pertusum]